MQNNSSVFPFYDHKGIKIPTFIYGTAWKEDQTSDLVKLALKAGFRGIDTANQRKHYHEAGVGDALKQVFLENQIKRGDLFIQTKFTYARGQDHRLPYDSNASLTTQVEQSFTSSLDHLGITYIDSYVLHGPASNHDLTQADLEVWQSMEELHTSGKVKFLGVSNIEYGQLVKLIDHANIKPAFVQNRCFARTQWDVQIRKLCHANEILYQGFSLLTANSVEIASPSIHRIAQRLDCSIPQVIFRFALEIGMIPLTGTTDIENMRNDLEVYNLSLTEEEIETIEHIAQS